MPDRSRPVDDQVESMPDASPRSHLSGDGPYVVTMTRPCRLAETGSPKRASATCPLCESSCRAVTTLDEAREAARELCLYAPGSNEEIAQAVRDVFGLTESGGTVGPLPDGTVIEVKRLEWYELRFLTPDAEQTPQDHLVEKFNAAQEARDVA